MATTLQQITEKLVRKISGLRTRVEESEKLCATLEAENAELRAEIKELREQMEADKIDREFLTMSHKLASSPDEVINARRKIAGLIRDIDKCISQLKE